MAAQLLAPIMYVSKACWAEKGGACGDPVCTHWSCTNWSSGVDSQRAMLSDMTSVHYRESRRDNALGNH
eukprot:350052-Chlamydomonas_euryale.AAC.1